MNLEFRNWQKEAIKRSDREVKGIFLEALGGRGKTICALAIAEHKKAKKVLIINNQNDILDGWKSTIEEHFSKSQIEFLVKTDKWLKRCLKEIKKLEDERSQEKKKYNSNRKMYSKSSLYKKLQSELKALKSTIKVDVLIIDEWQNVCSANNISNFVKVKRDYTIGLSATPIRKKGLNFYPLEKTIFGKAEPNQLINWTKYHGLMEYDPYAYTKEVWRDFRDYESYINRLDLWENFMRWETIEALENAPENNGFDVTMFYPKVEVPKKNVSKLASLEKFNVVEADGNFIMGKSKFGRKHFIRYLKQSNVTIEGHKLVPTNEQSPLMTMVQGMIERSPHGLLIVGSSKSVVCAIYNQNKGKDYVGLMTGDEKINHENARVLLATSQKVGVGIDGFQFRFKTLLSLDPIQDLESGEYTDYLQLLWRIKGSRQQQDINVVEVEYVLPK